MSYYLVKVNFETGEVKQNGDAVTRKIEFLVSGEYVIEVETKVAQYLDGKISALVGTHTHIQTSDERILPNGTGYITDVGMTGPYDSVIGMKSTAAINRFLFATPQKYETAKDNVHLTGMFFKIDSETGKTLEVERIFFPEFDKLTTIKDAESSASKN